MLALIACGLVLVGGAEARAQTVGGFEERSIPLRTNSLFDFGVADTDQDGDLDVFTTNHNAQESLLANDGEGGFTDRLSEVRLDQTPDFPGWTENPNTPEDMSDSGLYIHRNHQVILDYVGAPPGGTVTGTVEFLAPVRILQATNADLSVSEDPAAVPPRTLVSFSAGEDSRIALSPKPLALPIELTIDEPLPIEQVFVGPRKVSPAAREFELYLRDRHGMAWGDFTGDGLIDVFIARGGVKGQVALFGGVIQDELMVNGGSTFEDRIAASGIVKGACRGRGVAPVDFDLDSRLDLFVACRTGPPQLYRQRLDGTFADFSEGLVGGRVRGSAFEWVDVFGDRDPELIAAREDRFVFYQRRQRDRWRKVQLVPGRQPKAVTNMTVSDYDNDGDFDLFAAARSGNTLLVNRSDRFRRADRRRGSNRRRGSKRPKPPDVESLGLKELRDLELFRAVKPSRVGLPNKDGRAASWVDYDNDGRADLHVFKKGLYRQVGRGRFQAASFPKVELPAEPSPEGLDPGEPAEDISSNALISWFDMDGNGTRDALTAFRANRAAREWEIRLLANTNTANHWLELELDGPPRNRQALGAAVQVEAGGEVQTQRVGQSDDSRFSQGHYRLYFGLGEAAGVQGLKVTWPDGSILRRGPFEADRVLRFSHGTVAPR